MNDTQDNEITVREELDAALRDAKGDAAKRASKLAQAAGELDHAVGDGHEGDRVHDLAAEVLELALYFADPSPPRKPPPGDVLACARWVLKAYAERTSGARPGLDAELLDSMAALDEAIDAHDDAEGG